MSKKEALSKQEPSTPSEDEATYTLLRDGKRIPKPSPAIMMSMEGATAAHTVVTIIHNGPKVPRFTGEEGGVDVHTFLSNLDDVITKRRWTTDEDKINVLRDFVDPSDLYDSSQWVIILTN